MPNDDRRNYSKKYLLARLLVLLGGRAAESVVFNEVTTGAENDLRHVTSLARRMVSQFGMSEAIGQLNFGDDDRQPFLGYSLSQGRNYSEETAAKIDAEVRDIVDSAYEQTLAIIEENRDKLEALAQALLENEIIDQDEILEILGLDLEDILPEDREKAEKIRKAIRSDHFSLNIRKEATDEGIIGEEQPVSEEEPGSDAAKVAENEDGAPAEEQHEQRGAD
jgi:hypothetical protein